MTWKRSRAQLENTVPTEISRAGGVHVDSRDRNYLARHRAACPEDWVGRECE